MNKKILFLILLGLLFLPTLIFAVNTPAQMAEGIKTVAMSVGIALVVVGWVVAGILYLTAAGAPDKLGTAKKAMIAAIVGTILVIIATTGYEAIKTFLQPITG